MFQHKPVAKKKYSNMKICSVVDMGFCSVLLYLPMGSADETIHILITLSCPEEAIWNSCLLPDLKMYFEMHQEHNKTRFLILNECLLIQ